MRKNFKEKKLLNECLIKVQVIYSEKKLGDCINAKGTMQFEWEYQKRKRLSL